VPATACACASAPVRACVVLHTHINTRDIRHILPIFHRTFGILIASGARFFPFSPAPGKYCVSFPQKMSYCVCYARRDTRFFYFRFF
jgi:hypothetical protein